MTRGWPGQVLVEMLIALGMAVLGLLSLVVVANKSIANSGYAKRQAQANGYSTQIMEYVRNQKDTLGWTLFQTTYGAGSYCYNGTTLSGGSNCAIAGSEFRNTVTISYSRINPPPQGVDQMAVEVQVSWTDSGVPQYSRQNTQFTRY